MKTTFHIIKLAQIWDPQNTLGMWKLISLLFIEQKVHDLQRPCFMELAAEITSANLLESSVERLSWFPEQA